MPTYPLTDTFTSQLEFPPDPFQRTACEHIENGYGVLVAAPTGAGKTVVGEFAVFAALATGRKCFYTTPIKALSNQKYNDLLSVHGPENVGLLTGDNAINAEAPIVVMTTEVLRNMLYTGAARLLNLGYVVMDEVHYLADRFRGAVWEEVILRLPESVTLVSLSATVSNAEEFAEWLITVRGHTEVVLSEERPVPLWQHMMVRNGLYDLFTASSETEEKSLNPQLMKAARNVVRRDPALRGFGRGRRGRTPRGTVPLRFEVLEKLREMELLPAITFIFSRAACDDAVRQCVAAKLDLTTEEERDRIAEIAEHRTAEIPEADLRILGYDEWLYAAERGVAAHHAGMLPVFKELVEELFVKGLVKAVFATETLALGINMPARSVVLERLVKYNGEAHVDLTPGEYTQLTGRAGRRGIDVEGHAVVLWNPQMDIERVGGLASTRTYPLNSSFSPSYNMAVNLVATVGSEAARELLETSFAQFQADRAVVTLARSAQRNNEILESDAPMMSCDKGEFSEYFAIRLALSERERILKRERGSGEKREVEKAFSGMRRGDVVVLHSAGTPASSRRSRSAKGVTHAVVLEAHQRPGKPQRPLLLDEHKRMRRVSPNEFAHVSVRTRVRMPRHLNYRVPQHRRELLLMLERSISELPPYRAPRHAGSSKRQHSSASHDAQLRKLRRKLRAHPCHACPEREEHARIAERHHKLKTETETLEEQVHHRTSSLARTFDRVCEVLRARGYLRKSSDGLDEITQDGKTLARIWAETDLLIAECIRSHVFASLSPAELAAALTPLVYSSRAEDSGHVGLPPGELAEALGTVLELSKGIREHERQLGLGLTPEPDCGFVWPMLRWARGESLGKVLTAVSGLDEMAPGDFVRWARQVIDLLGQFERVPGVSEELRENAAQAIREVRRGIVAG